MALSRNRVLVAGATGNQGGAVLSHLIEKGDQFEVHALTRDPQQEVAQALSRKGAKVVRGDLSDPSSLKPLVEKVDSVFCVANFWTLGYDLQVQYCKNLADVANEVGIDHFVFSGVGSHDQDTGIPHFDSAWEIDQHIQKLGLPATILKPVFFMQNFEAMVEDILDGTLAFPLKKGVSLQMIDVDDVGRIAALAFSEPDRFIGKSMDLAGDEHTLKETANIFSEITGVDVQPYYVSIEDAREQAGEEWAVMCDWFNKIGYSSDIPALEEEVGFTLTKLDEYLQKHGWQNKSAPDAVPGWVKAMQAQD
jgi:uncharacterized protein YbjT (DUF2867 family)